MPQRRTAPARGAADGPARAEAIAFTGVIQADPLRDIGSPGEAETARRHLAAIVASSDDAILSKSPEGVITSWNPAAERLFGFTAAEAIGRRVSIVVPFERAHEERLLLENALRGRAVGQHETWRLTKDGRRIDVSLSVSPIFDEAGVAVGASVIARDITERKRVEDALRESRRRLADAQRRAQLGSWETDPVSGETTASAELNRIWGLEEDRRGFDYMSTVHEDDRELASELGRQALEGARPLDAQFRVVRPDGAIRVVHARAELIFEAGRPRVVGTTQDVTERVRAEADVRRLGLQTQAILDAAGEGIFGLDRHGRITFVNPAAARMTGWEAASLIGRDMPGTFHHSRHDGSAYPREECPAMRVLEGGSELAADDEVFWRRDGTSFPVELVGTPILEAGEVAGAVISFKDVSERRAAEKALRESEARLQAILDSTASAIYVKDLKGRYLLVNRAAEAMLGLSTERVIGRTDHELLPPALADERRAAELEVLRGDDQRSTERTGTGVDERHTFLTDRFLLHDADGDPYALCGISTDITDRKRAEEALVASRARMREAQHVARLGSWERDLSDGRMTLSDELLAILGLAAGEFDGTLDGLLERIHPDDRPAAEKQARENAAGEEPVPTDYRFVWPDGTIRTLHFLGAAERDEDGRPRRLLGTLQDVTEQRSAEEELRRISRLHEAILASAGEGILGLDLEEQVTFVNPAAARLTGWTAEELIGGPLHEIVHHSHADGTPYPAEDCPVLAVLRDGRPRTVDDDVFWRSDGTPFPIELISTPIQVDGRITGAVVTFRDIGERKRAEAQLQYLADHDALTGLYSRRRFEEELARQVSVAARRGGGGAVLLLDLDNFRDVNDSLGHVVGDELLKQVAGLLEGRLRASDVLARLGGDEFGLILPGSELADAEAVAASLLEVVRDGAFAASEERRMSITTSIGIVLLEELGGQSAEDPLVCADLALYEAKEAGRDCCAVYSASRHAELETRLTETEQIRRALEEDLFVLHWQPIVELATGRVKRYEVLLRMRGEDEQLIPPGAFLRTAERLGLIRDIDRWVVGRAIELIGEHGSAGSPLCLEVNLSGRSVSDQALLAFIEQRVRATAIDPASLIFEITETAAIANMEQARAFAESLTRLGCRFALDDFGTGFASYYYLKYLPVEALKIDRDFIRNISQNRIDQLVVEAAVGVARGLGKDTIAEGIEDEETLELVRRYGVTYAQGYHLGRPGPIPPVAALRGT